MKTSTAKSNPAMPPSVMFVVSHDFANGVKSTQIQFSLPDLGEAEMKQLLADINGMWNVQDVRPGFKTTRGVTLIVTLKCTQVTRLAIYVIAHAIRRAADAEAIYVWGMLQRQYLPNKQIDILLRKRKPGPYITIG
ncbi:MAG TPA: hypothetical protein VF272_01385 [Candidatus Saccharimonadia bacterium]